MNTSAHAAVEAHDRFVGELLQRQAICTGARQQNRAQRVMPGHQQLQRGLHPLRLRPQHHGPLRRIRRRLLAHGVLMAFALVAIGDAEWRLPMRPGHAPAPSTPG